MKMLNPPEGNPVVIPAFIAKLWHMVSDPESDNLISWGYDGTSFLIKDHNKFSSEMLPRYYKHNNMASFIRQLNMYSFHKVLSIDSPSLKNNKELEFSHPYFLKDQPNLLRKIQRKIHTKEGGGDLVKADHSRYNKLLMEVKQLRAVQELFGSKLSTMKQENAALWREYSILRQRHTKQEKIVNKVIQFLVTMVQQSSHFAHRKVGIPLMIKDKPIVTQKKRYMLDTSDGPIICEIDPKDIKVEGKKGNETYRIIRSCNKPEVRTIPSEIYQLPAGNKITVSQGIPVQISGAQNTANTQNSINTEPAIQLLNALQGEALKIPEASEPNTANSNTLLPQEQPEPIVNTKLTSEKPKVKVKTTQPLRLKIKRKGMKKSGGPEKKKKKVEETVSLQNIAVPSVLDEFILPHEHESSDFPTADNQPIVTSPSLSFEARTPVPSNMSPLNDPTAEINLTDNLLEGKPLSYLTDLIEKEDQEQAGQSTSNRPELERSNSLSLIPSHIPENLTCKEEADSQLDKIQSEIDILKEILQNDGLTLDANTIMELFKEDPLSLNFPPVSNTASSSSASDVKNELISYTPSFDVDLSDINDEDQDPLLESENLLHSSLNTPQIQLNNPDFPVFPN